VSIEDMSIQDNGHESLTLPTDQNGLMSLWIIQYTYDKRTDLRATLLDDHLSYLRGLADAGAMIGYGKFDDEVDEPGALLVASAPTKQHVEDLVNGDPFVIVETVSAVNIRPWDGHLAPSWRGEQPPVTDR
jgi:uncharacterized protein YciI